MEESTEIILPESGIAADVLARFIVDAQVKADCNRDAMEPLRTKTAYHLVAFQLDGETYGVEIDQVQEIIRAAEITAVPGAPAHVRGVINLRGKIIPVVDLRIRFNMPESGASEEQRIIVVELGKKRLGMLVDSVSHVIRLPSASIEDIPEEAVTLEENYIKGVGKLERQLIIILDLNRSLLLTEGS
ncbi:MAG: chemotaxis protein CheW [Deltaproteobacteria bacterium]|nr:chemotaxis protein CheW [Deltaproteobacteria bacterium]